MNMLLKTKQQTKRGFCTGPKQQDKTVYSNHTTHLVKDEVSESLTERFEEFFKIFTALHLPGSSKIRHLDLFLCITLAFKNLPFNSETQLTDLQPLFRSKRLSVSSLSHPVSSRVSPSLSFGLCVTPSGPLLIASICDVRQWSLPPRWM